MGSPYHSFPPGPRGRITEPLSQELSLNKVKHTTWTVCPGLSLGLFPHTPRCKGGPSPCPGFQRRWLRMGGAKDGAHGDLPVTPDTWPELLGARRGPRNTEW